MLMILYQHDYLAAVTLLGDGVLRDRSGDQ